MKRRRKKKRTKAPPVCRFEGPDGRLCGAPIAWIPGVRYPVNPGRIEIILWGEGSPRIEGVTLHGDECWGRKREPGEDGRVVEVWTRHICEHRDAGRRAPRPAPDPSKKWGVDRSLGEPEDED